MAKASDNLFPYVHLVPAAAPAAPAAGAERLFLDSGDSNKLKRKNSAGTVTTVEGGGSVTPGERIVCNRTGLGASYTTTSTTFADIDATNLTAAVTTPSGGKRYMVTLQARLSHSVANGLAAFDFTIDGTRAVSAATTGSGVRLISIVSTGTSWEVSIVYITASLAAGSHTIKPQWRTNTGTLTMVALADELVQFSVLEL